jgi:ubiquinone/menaquinone biosynthesis C-methylase UbiE
MLGHGRARDEVARETVRTYERIAPLYDTLDGPYEIAWKRRLRRSVFAGLSGRILDAGVGTGCNFVAYPPEAEMVGVDLSPAMLERARKRAARNRIRVQLAPMDLTRLSFPDGSFDAVVATFVFGCIPDQAQLPALREVARVCRPDGEIRLLDYVMPDQPIVRLGMEVMSPWLSWAFGGTYRPTTSFWFAAAGLEVVRRQPMAGGVTQLYVLRPAGKNFQD